MVAVKRVIDPYVKVRVKADGSDIEPNKMAMNPFDEIAVEEAVRLKEKGIVTEIIAVSIGDQSVAETLRTALALGADSAIHIETSVQFEPLNIAKILQKIIEQNGPKLVIMGKQAIDGDNNQTGQILASLLDWPAATFASKLVVDGAQAIVTREVDGGLETMSMDLPAIVTTDLRLNEPRYATLPNIMQAKRKPLSVMPVDELGLDLSAHTKILNYEVPTIEKSGVKLDTVEQLVEKLQREAKVL